MKITSGKVGHYVRQGLGVSALVNFIKMRGKEISASEKKKVSSNRTFLGFSWVVDRVVAEIEGWPDVGPRQLRLDFLFLFLFLIIYIITFCYFVYLISEVN